MQVSEMRIKFRELTNTTTLDYPDSSLIRDLNAELSNIQINILRDRGALEFDDTNFSDLPIATFNIIAGQREYKITADEDGNRLLTIHKVAYQDGTRFVDVPRSTVAEGSQQALVAEGTGKPRKYYEVGSSVVFDIDPDFSGLGKIWFDREMDVILTSDTTKEPGIPRAYHLLAVYRTAYNYAIDKGLSNENSILRRITMEEERMAQFEANRRVDEQTVMSPAVIHGI